MAYQGVKTASEAMGVVVMVYGCLVRESKVEGRSHFRHWQERVA